MYEQHYGLDRRLFKSSASASDVFVGPQTAKFLHGAKKALAAPDAAIAVIGAAGVGKTTLVNRSLEGSDFELTVIRIARLQLGHDEILEFLLEELGGVDVPASTIKKIALLKRLISERIASGTRIVIVIEDAVWIGDDALTELEALTAADGHDCEGANIILMGDGALKQILQRDSLARLHQRVRFNSIVKPLATNELSAYLKHAFRLAGGDFDRLFADDTALYLHRLTGGIPRIANNLVESVLVAGAEKRLASIDNALIARIAQDEYGLTAEFPLAATAQLDSDRAPAPASDAKATPPAPLTPATKTEPEVDLISQSQLGVGPKFGIAGLISNTLPDLDKLAPDLLAAGDEDSDSDSEIDLANLPDSFLSKVVEDKGDIPTLFDSGRLRVSLVEGRAKDSAEIPILPVALEPENDHDATPLPEIERDVAAEKERALDISIEENIAIATAALEKHDATIAEYIHSSAAFANYIKEAEVESHSLPDLESATPAASPEAKPRLRPSPDVESAAPAASPAEEPQLQASPDIETAPPATNPEAKPALRISPDVESATRAALPADRAATAQHVKIAGELSAAETLDDVDDKMAESLFCTQIGKIASKAAGEVHASAPAKTSRSATDVFELTLVDDEPQVDTAAGPSESAGNNPATATSPDMQHEPPRAERRAPNAPAGEPPAPAPVLAMTATQRLETVRALNAKGRPPSVAIPATAAVGTPSAGPAPRPIEDQIKMVVPEALRALGVAPHTANDEDDDDDAEEAPRKGGFFSRFRRS